MNCACPKCKTRIQLDQTQLSEVESAITCTECKTRFLVYRESYACRALRKSHEIICAKCGNEIGHSLHCDSCGALYPDYYVATLHRKRTREKIQVADSFSFVADKAKRPSFKPQPSVHAASAKDAKAASKKLRIALVIGLAAVLIAGSFGYFYINKIGKQYSANMIMALYGVKSGSDMSLKICSKISEEWKVKSEAGSSIEPRISPQDEATLKKIKVEVDIAMQKLANPPSSFVKPVEKLTSLYDTYNKIYQLALAPQPPLSRFTENVSKLESSFNRSALEFKGSLSAKMLEEIRNTSTKYKNLQFLN